MREQFDDYEKRIMEEIDRQAEEIQQALKECPQAAEARASETLDQKVYAGIEAYEKAVAARKNSEEVTNTNTDTTDTEDAAFAALSEEDREALRLGRELQARRKEESSKTSKKKVGIRKHIGRIAAAVVVVVITASVGVKSIGGAERIVEIVKDTFNGREVSKINSSKDAVKNDDVEEEQAYQQIKDELGIDPVKIVIMPGEMKYKYCEVDSDIRMAQLLYNYGNKNISYFIDASYTKESWGTDIEDKKTDEYDYIKDKLEAKVTEYELTETGEMEYTAEFEYQGIYYQLTAAIEWEKFEEILKNLHFPA